jgi:hypothetical protein
MNKDFLKLAGRVVSANAADQSVLIESTESTNRLRVYADSKAFQRLNNSLLSVQFKGVKGKKLTGTFYIQGRVLMGCTFNPPSLLDIARAFGAVKYSPEHPK